MSQVDLAPDRCSAVGHAQSHHRLLLTKCQALLCLSFKHSHPPIIHRYSVATPPGTVLFIFSEELSRPIKNIRGSLSTSLHVPLFPAGRLMPSGFLSFFQVLQTSLDVQICMNLPLIHRHLLNERHTTNNIHPFSKQLVLCWVVGCECDK